MANPETVVSSADSADLIGCCEDSLEPICTTELFSPEPTSAYTTSQVSPSWHDHSAPAGSPPAYADVFKFPTTMSNFSPPRDTPASKSSAVPKTASLNLKSPPIQLPTTAEPTVTTDVPPVVSIQQDQQQPSNTSRPSQNQTRTFTFDPLESAPPRPWNLSDTPTYIPRRHYMTSPTSRSEERRVGKECQPRCRSRWSPYH